MKETEFKTHDIAPQLATLDGELRSASYGLGLRLLQAITFVTAVRAITRLMARYMLAYRRSCTLELQPGKLYLNTEHRALGRTLRTSTRLLGLEHLIELRIDEHGDNPGFYAGLSGLFLGTMCGSWMLVDGVTRGATSLMIWGAFVLLLGITSDFLLGSGRRPPAFSGHAQLTVKASHRAFVISPVDLNHARAFLHLVGAQYMTSLSEPSPPVSKTPGAST